jgi:hypothetical protein
VRRWSREGREIREKRESMELKEDGKHEDHGE